jgi:hypothetical protein
VIVLVGALSRNECGSQIDRGRNYRPFVFDLTSQVKCRINLIGNVVGRSPLGWRRLSGTPGFAVSVVGACVSLAVGVDSEFIPKQPATWAPLRTPDTRRKCRRRVSTLLSLSESAMAWA